MRRREFITALLSAAAISPTRAQRSAKVYRVAIVSPTPLLPEHSRVFVGERRRLGQVGGQNLLLESYAIERGALHDPELARDVFSRSQIPLCRISRRCPPRSRSSDSPPIRSRSASYRALHILVAI